MSLFLEPCCSPTKSMTSFLRSYLLNVKNPEKLHKICFWAYLVTFISDLKINLNDLKLPYAKFLFPNHLHSSPVWLYSVNKLQYFKPRCTIYNVINSHFTNSKHSSQKVTSCWSGWFHSNSNFHCIINHYLIGHYIMETDHLLPVRWMIIQDVECLLITVVTDLFQLTASFMCLCVIFTPCTPYKSKLDCITTYSITEQCKKA